jgi:ornithine cyclodeaminase/alanine dehydrogenase-like protein (mu-crystallin family)
MSGFLLLSRSDLRALMSFGDYVEAVAEAFRLLAEGRCQSPVPTEIAAQDGTFHIKAGALPNGPGYVAVKINGNFPSNKARHGLPTIQGAVYLADASDGRPLALLDSAEITLQRTGAATAVAARYLARKDSTTATICGCGEQGYIQLAALRHVLDLRTAFAWDADGDVARAFASRMTVETGIPVQAVDDLGESTRASDAIVTCTTAHAPFLGPEQVRPGTFVAAVGADNPAKSELTPELMAGGTVVADVLEQALFMGDLHHAVAVGTMTAAHVHAELGQLIMGEKPGRRNADEITIFDSTGIGIQDVAAASRAYELARKQGAGLACALS